jgi:hypothetical protein
MAQALGLGNADELKVEIPRGHLSHVTVFCACTTALQIVATSSLKSDILCHAGESMITDQLQILA